MPKGSLNIVLHTHLPYCRLAGRWPHGEEWFHEAMLECYLPLLRAFRRLADEIDGSLGITINVTPILAEQMGDPLMRQHFREYLDERIERARQDVERFQLDLGQRKQTATFHLERYESLRDFYENDLRADVLRAFRQLEASGHIEVATSAATHGYLPLLDDESAVRFQVQTGVRSHLRNFGREPRAFWLPECAYKPGLERFLEESGIKVFFVETHLVTGGHARGKTLGGVMGPYGVLEPEVPIEETAVTATEGTTFRAYHVGDSNVSVLARNERSGMQVWSAAYGYPGDPAYREFHKKDATSGLHYWRVTGPQVELGDKQLYNPEDALNAATEHARHFQTVVKGEMEAYREGTGEEGIVMASYDTELFGHWWLEGVAWLEMVIRAAAADPDIELVTAGDYVTRKPVREAIALPEGSWGNGGDHRTWLNDETEWTWPEIRKRQAEAQTLLRQSNEATQQLARELLLLQSSDWQFLMTTGQAHDYAIERFESHRDRFDQLARAIESESADLDALVSELYELDNPFADIDPALYAPLTSMAESRRR